MNKSAEAGVSPGQRIIAGLREALDGDIARVTIEGVTWVRQPSQDSASPDIGKVREALEATKVLLDNLDEGQVTDSTIYDIAHSAVYSALDALSASSAPPAGAAVKPLEWGHTLNKDGEHDGDEATTGVGDYTILTDPFSYSPTTAYYVEGPFGFKAQCASPNEAKAAAQADYEARIRSCLASPPADTAAIIERCAEDDPATVRKVALALQRENRTTSGMFNRDQIEASEASSLPAYEALARAAIRALNPGSAS